MPVSRKKTISLAAVSVFIAFTAASQSFPTMPIVTAPTISTGYYRPGSSTTTASSTIVSSEEEDSSSYQTTVSSTSTSSVTSALSTLTASDVASLGSEGILSTLTSLFDTDDDATGSTFNLTNLYTSDSDTDTNNLLKELLAKLEEAKQQELQAAQQTSASGTASSAANQSSAQKTSSTSANVDSLTNATGTNTSKQALAHPRLLRFSVNGYDILKTCRRIYISDVQSDGTFLVTGDRVYMSDGKTRTETFHILFTTSGTATSLSNYTAAAAVTQDYLNTYSFLYQLSQRQNLEAIRTGNLITMRTTDDNWKLELLIDLGASK